MLNNKDGKDISKWLLEQIKNNPDLLNNIK